MRNTFRFLALIITVLVQITASAQSLGEGGEKLYIYGDDTHAFVLRKPLDDQTGYDATLQMSNTGEVWTLERSQGVRGTVLYKNDAGRVFLRVNHIGGATLYPTPDSMGVPVLQTSIFRFERLEVLTPEAEKNLMSIEDWSRAYEYAGNKITKDETGS